MSGGELRVFIVGRKVGKAPGSHGRKPCAEGAFPDGARLSHSRLSLATRALYSCVEDGERYYGAHAGE